MNVDLRSDTVTKPTRAMRDAIASAEVGDDVFGEDPTVTALEQEVAGLLGMQAAMFVPTGSLANQIALRLLVAPGEELVCDALAHVVRAELGAAAALSGITTRTWRSHRGVVDVDAVAELIAPNAGGYHVSTAAIAVENTHAFGGGRVQPRDVLVELVGLARARGVRVHLDGARLWNAHVASGIPLDELTAGFDTVSVCLSKGLGAPVGSLLASTADRVADARVWRKRFGAGMRQAGVLAAGGRYAVRHHVSRLAEDHARARRLAAELGVDPETVETNMVLIEVDDAHRVAVAARQRGVLVSTLGERIVRLVTHLDLDDPAVDQAVKALVPLVRR